MRIAIAITFFYRHSRLEYLSQVCAAHRELGVEYSLFVITNTSEPREHRIIEINAKHEDIKIISPKYIGHPYLLTWAHRDIFREILANQLGYTHFFYTEDDLLFTRSNMTYWLEASEKLKPTTLIPGIMRYEINCNEEIVSSDITQQHQLESTPKIIIDGSTYVSLRQPYQGMYFLDKEQAIELLFTSASSPDTGIWGIREKAAQGLTYWNVPNGAYSRIVVPITEDNQIDPRSLVHHLPNNYANDPNMPGGKILIKDIFTTNQEQINKNPAG